MPHRLFSLVLLVAMSAPICSPTASAAEELVYLDPAGVVRWRADDREVALFGANYCLPSASDYRAAGLVGADRKQLVEKDLAHFARMGWDGMRLCLWGDWENCDRQGNLIVNDHLDLMDYAIAVAKQRSIYILFTPITTYSAWWPDAPQDTPYPGFSKFFQRHELGTHPDAIAAQVNYVRQIMEHVNPYTGVALKDEPQIIFVEMINEPVHQAHDFAGSVDYINALAGAVRDTGCKKILFHNVSQDFRITPAVRASSVEGVTFAWYPTGLNLNRELTENYLRTVDDFPPMWRPDLQGVPSLVYEFDSADMNSGYMYPAMARAFRGAGAQFIAMFSYDMVDTAPYNLGWQTHFLNLVFSPKKAVSAIIAAEVTREIPRQARYGDYPDNTRFGPFRVSYAEDSSEMVTAEGFLHANATATPALDPAALRRIVGVGSSPLVAYEGGGAYFLDRLGEGVWRLELYPDAVIVRDPFARQFHTEAVSSRLVARPWPMTVRLPDLGDSFAVTPLNDGNTHAATAGAGAFPAQPGVYLLSRGAPPDRASLPERIGQVGLTEFFCPPAPELPPQILPRVRATHLADQPTLVGADVVGPLAPESVTFHLVQPDRAAVAVPLTRQNGYRYEAALSAGAGAAQGYFTATFGANEVVRFPAGDDETLSLQFVAPRSVLTLFAGSTDVPGLVYTRIGDNIRRGIFRAMPATADDPAALRLFFPLSYDRTLEDYTASLAIKDRLGDRGAAIGEARALRVQARGAGDGQQIHLTLVESDGTSWGALLKLTARWQDLEIPLADLRLARGVKLPLGFPERWNYWLTPAKGRGAPDDRPRMADVEHVQISFRPIPGAPKSETDSWADIASVALVFE